MTYGPNPEYVRMAVRALELWKDNEKRWNRKLFYRTGVLFEGVNWAIYEKESGFLTARRNCQIVLEDFLAEGGEYRQALVTLCEIHGHEMSFVGLADSTRVSVDQYVFACGPWLGKLFPGVIGDLIRPTRQEVFFFGVPADDLRYSEGQMPAWDDHGPTCLYYGVPASDWRGFKAADDTRGDDFDPTNADRLPTADAIRNIRDYVEFRFPGLKGAPLVEARVCQYENTPDQNFVIDRHPEAENTWLLGGGSGHGYKH